RLRNVGSQISASHVSTTHLMQLIDFADIVAGVKDVNEIVNARRGNERIIDHFKIEEEKHVEHCREQISEILSSWRMENRVSRLLYRIPPADLFERKVASIVARLLRCEETSQVSEKEINEKLETLLQRERELNEQFDDTNRAMAKVAIDIEVKKQRIHIFEERASKNRERKIELEKRIGNEERAVNSSQKQFHKNTSLLAELVHKKGDYEAQV
uniref:Uncharacterized protein n=1 Tax=Parascaris univalens TaxID=6257 RepID=A0A915A3F7_PARUN